MFGIGRGSAEVYKCCCVKAIRSLGPEAICWRDEPERQAIANRIFTQYDVMNCIAVAYGTEFPLTMHHSQMTEIIMDGSTCIHSRWRL